MYTARDKTQEKERNFSSSGLLTGQWKNTETAQKTMSQENKITSISLDELLKPQFEQGGSQGNYYGNDNSVYNPNSNLGNSIFAKDSLDYYLDQVNEQNKENKQNKAEQKNEKNVYLLIGALAIGYLGYRIL